MKKIYEVTITGTEPVLAESPQRALEIANSTKGDWPTLEADRVEEANLDRIDKNVCPWGGEGRTCDEIMKDVVIDGFHRLPDGFIDALKKVMICIKPQHGSRRNLEGAHIKVSSGEMSITGTDGFRLSQVTLPAYGEWPEVSDGVTVRLDSLKNIIEAHQDDNVIWARKIGVSMLFTDDPTGDQRTLAALTEDKFPEYEQLLQQSATPATANRKTLLGAVQWMKKPACKRVNNGVELSVSGGFLTLRAWNGADGEWTRKIQCAHSGSPSLATFNYRDLKDALESFDSDSIRIEIPGGQKPTIFTSPDEDLTHVLMPIFEYLQSPFEVLGCGSEDNKQ